MIRQLFAIGVACILLDTALVAQSAVLTPVKDNTLYESNTGDKSNGAGTRMFAGMTDDPDMRRALVVFDVAASVPACATITSVSLQMVCVMTQAPATPVTLHEASADWGEAGSVAGGGQGGGGNAQPGDATWLHTFRPGSLWATPGGDYDGTASATTSVAGPGSYTWTSTPGLVADVQGWLDTPSSNFGWLVRGFEVGSQTAKAFATREDSNVANRPTLTITYTTGNAASTSTTGTGCVGSSTVPFTLSAVGVPSLGNGSFALSLSGGPANGLASLYVALGVSANPVPLTPGCLIYLDLPSALMFINQGITPLNLPLDGSGAVSLPIPISNDCGIVGTSLSGQAIAIDSVGFISTGALTLNVGF